MRHHYAPEFLNRIDDIVVFNRLSKTALKEILDIRLREIGDRLVDKRIILQLTDEAKHCCATWAMIQLMVLVHLIEY